MTGRDTLLSTRIVTLPNVISLIRLASVPVFLWLFISGAKNEAVVLYGFGAASDWLDGYLARHTHAVSALGRLLDPLADRIFVGALAVALVVTGDLPSPLAVALVARDVLLLAGWLLFNKRGARGIPVSRTGKLATALLLAGLTGMATAATTWAFADRWSTIGLGLVVCGTVLYWAAALAYARQTLR